MKIRVIWQVFTSLYRGLKNVFSAVFKCRVNVFLASQVIYLLFIFSYLVEKKLQPDRSQTKLFELLVWCAARL